MVAVTLRTKILFFFSFLIVSCGERIIIKEDELINGINIQKFIRLNEFSGKITIKYIENNTIKSKREYINGKKNGTHEGWWPDGTKKFNFQFRNDSSEGEHFQWHSNGQLFTHKIFKNGLEEGEQRAWDMNGDLMYKYIYNNGRKYGIQGSIICNSEKDLVINNDSIN